VLGAVLLVRGLGIGSSMMPTMVAAYAVLRPRDVPDATPQLNAGPHLIAGAFAATYWWAIAVTAVAVIPAFVLLRVERRPRTIAEHRRVRAPEAEAAA
jgi:hypothetical protein